MFFFLSLQTACILTLSDFHPKIALAKAREAIANIPASKVKREQAKFAVRRPLSETLKMYD